MNGPTFRERFIDPRSPDRRPRRAAYVLPTLFTSGNIFLGFLAILQSFQGALAAKVATLDRTRISRWPQRLSDSPCSSMAWMAALHA